MSIWDIGKPSVTVEKRTVAGRPKKPRGERKLVDRRVYGSAARSAHNTLKHSPLTFPRDWWEPGR